jgi:hypothetical protein
MCHLSLLFNRMLSSAWARKPCLNGIGGRGGGRGWKKKTKKGARENGSTLFFARLENVRKKNTPINTFSPFDDAPLRPSYGVDEASRPPGIDADRGCRWARRRSALRVGEAWRRRRRRSP